MFGNHLIESVIYAVKSVSIYGSPRRCGGQGDILSGRQVITFLHYICEIPSRKLYDTVFLNCSSLSRIEFSLQCCCLFVVGTPTY
jgi:hypothetical protein